MRILALALSFFSLSPTPLSSVEFKFEFPGPSSYEHMDSHPSRVCSSDRLRVDVLSLWSSALFILALFDVGWGLKTSSKVVGLDLDLDDAHVEMER